MNRTSMNRRTFVSGAGAVVAGSVTAGLFASSSSAMPASAAQLVRSGGHHAPVDLFKHHCTLVHREMSEKLTRIVADPQVSPIETATALKKSVCPCCNTRIGPAVHATGTNRTTAGVTHV